MAMFDFLLSQEARLKALWQKWLAWENCEGESDSFEAFKEREELELLCVDRIPECVLLMPNLKSLKILADNCLKRRPLSVRNISFLKDARSLINLEIGSAYIQKIPPEICEIKQLKKLSLINCEFAEFPIAIFNMTNLEELCICHTSFTEISKEIANLKNLKSLSINQKDLHSQNGLLKRLPDEITKLNLERLNIEQNPGLELTEEQKTWLLSIERAKADFDLDNLRDERLGEPPNWLIELWKWADKNKINNRELARSQSKIMRERSIAIAKKIKKLPDALFEFKSLQRLIIDSKGAMENLQEEIANFAELESFHIENSAIKTLPNEFAKLTNLKHFGAENCPFSEFPKAVCKLKNLETFRAENCNITKVSEEIGKLGKLWRFEAENNRISELPDSFANLSELKQLKLSNNPLGAVPEAIKNLKNLEKLELQNAGFETLPEWIADMDNLTDLDISGNRITNLPASLERSKLKVIYLDGNPIDQKAMAKRFKNISIPCDDFESNEDMEKIVRVAVGEELAKRLDPNKEHFSEFKISLDWKSDVENLEFLLKEILKRFFQISPELPSYKKYGKNASVSYENVLINYDNALREHGLQMGFFAGMSGDEYSFIVHQIAAKEELKKLFDAIEDKYAEADEVTP